MVSFGKIYEKNLSGKKLWFSTDTTAFSEDAISYLPFIFETQVLYQRST